MTRALIKHDKDVLPWPSRMDDPAWQYHGDFPYPAPRSTHIAPRGRKNTIKYSIPWLKYLFTVLNTGEEAAHLAGIGAVLFNRMGNTHYRKVHNGRIPHDYLEVIKKENLPVSQEIIAMSNEVEVIERRNRWSRIRTFNIKDDPPWEKNYKTHPHLCCLGTSVKKGTGKIGLVGGKYIFWPLVTNGEEAWIEDIYLDFDLVTDPPPRPRTAPIEI